MKNEIQKLKQELDAVILAHNYCRAEIQEIADFTGDSLELARIATQVDAKTIVFCGVYFMAETAAILNPNKSVLIPDRLAGCPMADMITGEQLRQMKGENPKAKAVCYVNSTAEVKAECDICVTSGNAAQLMKKFSPDEEILFVPDQHLGSHIMKILGRDYKLWPGYCPVHAMITSSDVEKARLKYPGAVVMVHPECSKEVREAADEQLSTCKMCEFARISGKNEFVVGTELGILHRLRKENPDKKFYPINENVVCVDMKKITLEKLRDSMKFNEFVVKVPEDIALRARKAIMAMLSI
jgi:quinolinate synthase